MKRRKILPFCSQQSFPPSVISYLKLFLLVQNSPNNCFSDFLFSFSLITFQQYFIVPGISLPVFIRFSSLFFYYQPLCLGCSLLTQSHCKNKRFRRTNNIQKQIVLRQQCQFSVSVPCARAVRSSLTGEFKLLILLFVRRITVKIQALPANPVQTRQDTIDGRLLCQEQTDGRDCVRRNEGDASFSFLHIYWLLLVINNPIVL